MKKNSQDTLVVTATLGDRSSLKRTIDSVKENGGERVKHILICPKDRKEELKSQYKIDIIQEPEDTKGIYGALNYAIKKHAKEYKYVTFINDDDYWLSGFEELFNILDKHDDIDIVYGRTLFVNENNKILGEQTCSRRYKSFKSLLTQKIVLFTQQATLMKSKVFIDLGGFDESYKLIADTKFWITAIDTEAKIHYKNTLAAAYTIQEGQLSSDKTTQEKERKRLLDEKMFDSVSFASGVFEKLLFRLTNSYIYIKNYLKYKR